MMRKQTLQQLQHKIKSLDELKVLRDLWAREGKTLVFTNGVFDLIHRGHVEYLAQARDLGDILVVGLNSDHSVKRIKGPTRPIQPQEDRALILAAFQFVDYITIFHEDTPIHVITTLVPDVLVKGGDYTIDTVVGHDIVEEHGGKTVILPFVKDKSSTSIIERILKTQGTASKTTEGNT